MKKFFAIAIAAVSVLFADHALAHDNKVKHGGTVQVAGGLSFELVCQNGSAIIYVEERGIQMATAGANGILTVIKGKEKKSGAARGRNWKHIGGTRRQACALDDGGCIDHVPKQARRPSAL